MTPSSHFCTLQIEVMHYNPLQALSPLDGRYSTATAPLRPYFSEFALIKYRVQVEVEYLISLMAVLQKMVFNPEELRNVYRNFSEQDADAIKLIERTTNHDVKAVEYFVREKVIELAPEISPEFVHFGLTSQDINNTAIPLSLKDATQEVLLPALREVVDKLAHLSHEWIDIPMLARTHGQPASPTRLGKEIKVFVERLNVQVSQWGLVPYSAKFGGATGNFNAHHVAYPQIDWPSFANYFVNDVLGLKRSATTTQIEHYDNLAAYCHNLLRINTILIDFSRDIWQYVAMNYFTQRIKEGEVGSSAMPHKVNPIDFENAEGNLGFANAILEYLAAKLPVSRLQRDLTDSTVLRNLGVPLGHTLVALKSLSKGINKLQVNEAKIREDLGENVAILAEAIQTILRSIGYPDPYNALKALTRNNETQTLASLHAFIDSLAVEEDTKHQLKALRPDNYLGVRL